MIKFTEGDYFKMYCRTSDTRAIYKVNLGKAIRVSGDDEWGDFLWLAMVNKPEFQSTWCVTKVNHRKTKLGRILYK